jgi:hypothetical protein
MSRFCVMVAATQRLAAVAILLFVAVGLALPSSLRAETLPALAIGDLSERTLHAPVEWREGGANLPAVREQPVTPLHAGDANRGLTTKPYWLRVRLVNDSAEAVDWVITHEAGYLDHFDVFYRGSTASWRRRC